MMTTRRKTVVLGLTASVLAWGCSGSEVTPLGGTAVSQQAAALTHATVRPTVGCGDHADDHEHDGPEIRAAAKHRVGWRSPRFRKHRVTNVKVLGFNDFHGQLSAGRTVGGRPVGGAAVMASYLAEATARAEGGTLIVHAGDHVGASPPASALLQDEPSITFLNLLANRHCRGADTLSPRCNLVGTLGNHEFDEGKDEMLRLIYGGEHASGSFLEKPFAGARFGYISANVIDASTGEPLLPAYTIRQVGRARIGMVGAVLKETPSIVTPTGVAGLEFRDEADSINRAVRALKRRGVEAIGVTIHQGGRQTSYEGETTEGDPISGPIVDIVSQLDDAVDFVISGHAHSFTNALLPTASGHDILVTQAFSASTAFGELDLAIDLRTGDVVAKSAQIVTTYADVAPGDAPDPTVMALVKQAEELTDPLVNEVVAAAASDILREENAAGESALGNLIADAQRAATGADIAFMNPGGIRADLLQGEVTWGELFTIQPFGNSLVTVELTGQQIIDLLNQQWVGQSFPRILKSSGIDYVWDSAPADETSRIVSANVAGAPLELTATYSVTVNSFLAAGGDNFTVLLGGANPIGGDVDLDALIQYVKGLGQPFTAATEGRIGVL